MSLYEKVVRELKIKKERKERGLHNGIPFAFPRWQDYYPCIEKGQYIGVLAASGIGKSRFIRHTFVYKVIEFSLLADYPVKILYFALEDNKIAVYKKIIAHYLYKQKGIRVSAKLIDSINEPLPDNIMEHIINDEEFYKLVEDRLILINDALTPNQIADQCRKAHEAYGKTHHIIAIVDNYANLCQDPQDTSEYLAIKRFSRNLVRLELCKKMNLTVIAVLQADYESEKNAFRNVGKPISSLEPNLASLGEIKIISRDMYSVFALFAPIRYEILKYPSVKDGYDIGRLKNRFRSLIHLKSNEGDMAPRLPLYFDGGVEEFTEMPRLDDVALDNLYKHIEKEEAEKRERLYQTIFGKKR